MEEPFDADGTVADLVDVALVPVMVRTFDLTGKDGE